MITDLPEEILIDILSRLSVRTIVSCRCVTKTWHNLLSSSNTNFTKFHFNRSPVQFLIHHGVIKKFFLHLVELEDDTHLDSIKLLYRFRLSSYYDFCVVNSCNGFLCLGTAQSHFHPDKVCNPITGEYLNLPEYTNVSLKAGAGFGCSAKTNQYKVVSLVYRGCDYNPVLGYINEDVTALVYTIGTESWRTIGTAPKFSNQIHSTTYFNGAIHWVCYHKLSSDFIISFDLESEKFGVIPPPIHFSTETMKERRHTVWIGVLGEFLYLSYNMELWVMKEYGVQESWIKVYVVDRPFHWLQAIKYLSGGKILMNYGSMKLISYDPVEKICKESKDPWFCSFFKIYAHVPSFMSFNDAMMGDKGAKLHTEICELRVKGRDLLTKDT